MSSLYYGEIVSRITAHLFKNPAHQKRIVEALKSPQSAEDNLWTICAEAGRVFDQTEDIAADFYIDWHVALEKYSDQILDMFLDGQKPTLPQMLSMASNSLEDTIREMEN